MSATVLRTPLAPEDIALLKAIGEASGHALGVVCVEAGLGHRQKGLAAAHRRMLHMELHGLVRRMDDRKPIIWLRTPAGSEELRQREADPSALPSPDGGEG